MIKSWIRRPLPAFCAPFEKSFKNFYIIFSIVSSIIIIFIIEDWEQDVRLRVKYPKSDYSRAHPVTEMDYLWIKGVVVLLLLVLIVTVFCRYVLKKGCLIHILILSASLFWIMDTVHPFLLVYNDEPYILEGTTAFFIGLQILAHIPSGVFFAFASTGCSLLLLYCIEKVIRRIMRIIPGRDDF